MEQKINIAELLKDCPKGMELDCILFSAKVIYKGLSKRIPTHPIVVQTEHGFEFELTQYGQIHNIVGSNCVIFPKGKTTWEGFHKLFEPGDIVINDNNEHAFIYSGENDQFWECYCGVYCGTRDICINSKQWSDKRQELRLATEEEKEKLFQVIRDNGYHWNSKTKTLEKLFPYNIGTKVWVKSDKEHEYIHTIIGISHNCLGNLEYEVKEEKTGIIVHYPKELLIPITTKELKFKAGDKVRHKNNHNLVFTITSIEEDSYGCGANLALWFDDQDKYELIPDKFDINTLKPFDKVLVRDTDKRHWGIHFYEGYDKEDKTYPYRTLGGIVYKQCIPYKGNEDLAGFIKDCDDYYKTWINEENEFN